jgi:hypothetical protein
VACDGPRIGNASDAMLVDEVRNICSRIDWECEIQYNFQEHNIGCFLGPRVAIDWFFSHVEEGVILEDDCLPNEHFFLFMEVMLTRYRSDERILNVCGSNMGFENEFQQSYFFSRFMNMSGWGTWRRSAIAIDYHLVKWKNTHNKKWRAYKLLRTNILDLDTKWFRYWIDKFDKTVNLNDISWWDWQWIYYQLDTQKLSIISSVNLVSNIGFNERATHTTDSSNPLANVPTRDLTFPLLHPSKIKPDYDFEKIAVKWSWCFHKKESWVMFLRQFIAYLRN